MFYLINFSILSQSVLIFHVSLSIIYQLYDLILRSYILLSYDNCVRPMRKGLETETSPDLIYILPYYFYLVHVICYFYLTKLMSIYFYFISQVSL